MSSSAGPIRPINYRYAKDSDTFQKIDAVIQQNLATLRKDGVLTARPGYEITGGKVTPNPSVVVTVREKKDKAKIPAAQLLPDQLGGYPVDVRQAGTVEKLRADNPERFAALAATARNEMKLPEFENERDVATGKPVTSFETAAAQQVKKTQIPYTGPKGFNLDPVEDNMAILCHASPDAGWPTLKTFFGGIKKTLTVGMYDFTSAHVLQGLNADLKTADLTLTLDHPTKNPTADQSDEQTVATLEASLKNRMQFAWALENMDPKAPVFIYPNAYHIKVAVRDSATMWLSSGNWNNSNQPDIDPINKQPANFATIAKNSDRDWHVIVAHPGLSKTYEAYLQNDYAVANKAETGAGAAAPAAAAPAPAFPLSDKEVAGVTAELTSASVTPVAPTTYFAPKQIPANGTAKMKIQPILTPDNYIACVLPLIQSAKKSFYMQTQYIHPSDKPEDKPLADLINAVIELQKKKVDVKLILSEWEVNGTGGFLEKLQAAGLDLSAVKIQNGVHNKGVVVDYSVVMLGSQNWSADGVIRNRDASLIIYNSEAAQYYEQIFLHDWANMAQPAAAKG